MRWLFHMLHNSEGNSCCVGNVCCDGPLVIYTAALTEKWTAEHPRHPQVLPHSTQRQTQMGAWICPAWGGGDEKEVGRGGSEPQLSMS